MNVFVACFSKGSATIQRRKTREGWKRKEREREGGRGRGREISRREKRRNEIKVRAGWLLGREWFVGRIFRKLRPPAATGYVSPNDIRIAGSIGNRNFPTPLLLTSIALPSSPSLFFTAAAAFLPRSCARNYNKCRARNTRTEKYHSSRKWSNGVPFSFFFFFFRQRIFALERIPRMHTIARVTSRPVLVAK